MTTTVDVTGVFTPEFVQVFASARSVNASVFVSSKLMEHPVENGSARTDFRIIVPVEVTLGVILDPENYKQTYAQVRTIFNAGDSLTVQTKSASYQNMMIQEMPHEESPDYFDTLVMTIKLKEVILVQTRYLALPAKKVKNKNKQSTKKKGQQTPKTPAPASAEAKKSSSLLSRIFN